MKHHTPPALRLDGDSTRPRALRRSLVFTALSGLFVLNTAYAAGCPENTEPTGPELIVNGSFDDGLNGWTSAIPVGTESFIPGDGTAGVVTGSREAAFGSVNQNPLTIDGSWLYSNGNGTGDMTYWIQDATGLTAGETYVFTGRFSNTTDTNSDFPAIPVIQVAVDGEEKFEMMALSDDPDNWEIFEVSFEAAATTANLTLTDTGTVVGGVGALGYDMGTTGLSLKQCTPIGTVGSLVVNPESIDFGAIAEGGVSDTQTITVTKEGDLPITLGTVDPSLAPNFTVVDNNCNGVTLETPADSCTIVVQFEPGDGFVGATEGESISIPSSGDDVSFPLSGTAEAIPGAAIAFPGLASTGVNYGGLLANVDTAVETIPIQNTGGKTITNLVLTTSGSVAFGIDSETCGNELAAGASCEVVIHFTPTAVGDAVGNLRVNGSDEGTPVSGSMPLRGVGLADNTPGAAVGFSGVDENGDPVALDATGQDFGSVNVNDTSTKTLAIENSGGVDLTNVSVIIPGSSAFRIVENSCGTTLAVGDSCTVDVIFEPATAGSTTQTLQVQSDQASGEVPLRGIGVAVAVNPDTGERVLTDLDGGLGAAGLPLLSLLGAAGWFRRRRMSVAVAAAVGGAALVAGPVQAEQGEVYFGLGGGVSQLQPDENGTAYRVTDDSDLGFKVFLGYDITKHFSVEAYYADMGAAELTGPNNGDIEYDAFGLEGVVYLPSNSQGTAFFGKLGVANVNTDSTNIPFLEVEDSQVTAGLGIEHQFNGGVSLRGEYQFFDEDAQLLTVSAIKRFGGAAPPPPPPVIIEPPAPPPPAPVPEPPKDGDNDGVLDAQDKCPTTPVGTQVDGSGCAIDRDGDGVLNPNDKCPNTGYGVQVDSDGCPIVDRFNGVLEGVNFHTNSDRLTGQAMTILNGVADELNAYPSVRVVVVGHTDNEGSAAFNKDLSLRRAKSVSRYLVSKGVEADRMRYAGKGEEQPIATNATQEGRAQNRRVEFVASDY